MDGNIFSKTADDATTYPANSTNMPMYGVILNNCITFNHIGGLAVIRVDKMPAESGTLTVTADQQLSGGFKVSGLPNNPNIATASTDTEDDKKVTFTFSNATTNGVGVFYLPLATGDYTNLKVKINDTEVDCGSVTISRAGVTAIPVAVIPVAVNKVINGHTFVDLGLSVLWAETNVGASTAADFGNYYPYEERSNAVSEWGTSCSLPTKDQFQELLNNCNNSLTTQINSSNQSVNGYTFTSKKNGNSIFFPIAGKMSQFGSLMNEEQSQYWSSSSDSEEYVYYLMFGTSLDPSITQEYISDSDYNYSVRPVATK